MKTLRRVPLFENVCDSNGLNKANYEERDFREGSGDNLNMQGIRNEIDQDEIAICDPKDFFKTIDKRIIKLKSLMNIYKIKFKKELMGSMKRKSQVNVKNRLNMLNGLNK